MSWYAPDEEFERVREGVILRAAFGEAKKVWNPKIFRLDKDLNRKQIFFRRVARVERFREG
jgi:hypothetical protein